jgi:hypothetical protein
MHGHFLLDAWILVLVPDSKRGSANLAVDDIGYNDSCRLVSRSQHFLGIGNIPSRRYYANPRSFLQVRVPSTSTT